MASPVPGTAETRLALLEERVRRLEDRLARLSADALAPRTIPSAAGVVHPDEDAPLHTTGLPLVPRAGSVLAALSALGTSFLVLGGAFLIRTITESGALPTAAGIAVGFAYALAVIASADAVAGRGRRILAAFLLATAIGIGHPLVYEAVTRFHAAGPALAAAALGLLAGPCLAAARRRSLPAIAWAACLAMAATAFVLAAATGAIAPFAGSLLAVGLGVEWTPGPDAWRSARWPSALAADAMLVWLAAVAAAAPGALALFLALFALYVGGIAVRTFATHVEAGPFEIVQSLAAAAIGLAGATMAIRATGGSTAALGAAAMIAAVFGYVASLGPLSKAGRPHANASLAGALALGLALFGSACLLSGEVLAWLWLGFMAAMAAAAIAGRPALRAHVAAFGWAAAWQSGLLVASLTALLAPRRSGPFGFTPAALATVAAAWVVLSVAAARRRRRSPGGGASRVALAIVAGLGAAGLAVAVAAPLASRPAAAGVPGAGAVEPATLALIRSAALAATALAYAASARRWSLTELGGLAYATLVLWGAKLLIEDVPAGRPLTLFLAFALYGAILLWVPKILRAGASPTAHPDPAGAAPR